MMLEVKHAHAWDVSPREAIQIQRSLAELVREEPLTKLVETVAGVDVSVRGDRAQAAIVVLKLPEFEVIDRALWQCDVPFPYVPGLLSFREMPAILPALEKLRVWPDVFMTDSQGRAHPRRFGLACHLGVILDHPAVGVAKSLLVGHYDNLAEDAGASVPLVHKGETIGVALRTRARVNPVFVSVGHQMTLEDAVALTLRCTTKYKIPEPTRHAHNYSKNG
jgi:deoxyribonuclease V